MTVTVTVTVIVTVELNSDGFVFGSDDMVDECVEMGDQNLFQAFHGSW